MRCVLTRLSQVLLRKRAAHQEGIDVLAGVYGYAPAKVAVKVLLPEAARHLVCQ